jgi:integrase
MRIGLETGMRRMEILRIRLEHIDPAQRIIYIPKAKAGARTQPITAELASYLRTLLDQATAEQDQDNPKQTWLFPADSKTGHIVAIEKPFRRVVAAAGLDPKVVVRHTLRHTVISHLVQAGVDLPTVQRISGHKTLSMVLRYSHQSGEHLHAAMDRLTQRYQSGVEERPTNPASSGSSSASDPDTITQELHRQ